MHKSRLAPTPRPTVAYTAGCKIMLALACFYCRRELRAHDVELLDDGDARIVCPGCHRDLLRIEGQ